MRDYTKVSRISAGFGFAVDSLAPKQCPTDASLLTPIFIHFYSCSDRARHCDEQIRSKHFEKKYEAC